jgi:predicted amidohydrolase
MRGQISQSPDKPGHWPGSETLLLDVAESDSIHCASRTTCWALKFHRIFTKLDAILIGTMVKLGIIQLLVTPDKSANIESAASHVRACAAQGADIVVLPEIFNCPFSTSRFRAWPRRTASSSLAGRSVFNTSFVFGRDGAQIARHRKVHMFDIDVAGGQYFRESDAIAAGDEVTVFDTEFGRIGLCICFDMRFPELARLMGLEAR